MSNIAEYDNNTLRIFEEFADELLKVCPNMISREEIINRLKENLNGKTKYSLEEKVVGSRPTMEQLFLDLVSNIPTKVEDVQSDKQDEKSNINSQFFAGLIASVLGGIYNRAQGLIFHCSYKGAYANQLGIIFGDELISTYVRNNGNISSLSKYFCNQNGQQIDFNTLIGLISKVLELSEQKDRIDATVLNRILELNLTHLLENYLAINANLPDEEKIAKIETFIWHQIAPNFTLLKEIIEKSVKDKSLIKEDSATGFVYRVPSNYETDCEEALRESTCWSESDLERKFGKFRRMGIFGYNEEEYNTEKNIVMYNPRNDLAYIKNEEFFKALSEFIKNGSFSLDDVTVTSVINYDQDYYKVSTSNGDFYVAARKREMRKAMSIDEAMALYLEKRGEKRETPTPPRDGDGLDNLLEILSYESITSSEEYKRYKGYELGIEELNRLRNNGVTTVYVGNTGIIHEFADKAEATTISTQGASGPELITSILEKKNDIIEIPKRRVIPTKV